jgi:hypothetical protein
MRCMKLMMVGAVAVLAAACSTAGGQTYQSPAAWLKVIVSFANDSRMNWVLAAFADADQPDIRQQIFEAYGDRVVFTVEPRALPI